MFINQRACRFSLFPSADLPDLLLFRINFAERKALVYVPRNIADLSEAEVKPAHFSTLIKLCFSNYRVHRADNSAPVSLGNGTSFLLLFDPRRERR